MKSKSIGVLLSVIVSAFFNAFAGGVPTPSASASLVVNTVPSNLGNVCILPPRAIVPFMDLTIQNNSQQTTVFEGINLRRIGADDNIGKVVILGEQNRLISPPAE